MSWTHIQDPPPNKRQQEEDAAGEEARETKEAQESRMVVRGLVNPAPLQAVEVLRSALRVLSVCLMGQELYDEGITAQMEGRWTLAKRNYRLILESPLLQESVPSEQIHRRLKYLSLKNTAEILETEGEADEALKSYAVATGRLDREEQSREFAWRVLHSG